MAPDTQSPPLGKSTSGKKTLPCATISIAIKDRVLTVPVEDARLLRLLTESINAKHVVELGTANGYSRIWFALALQITGGNLTTFEIDPDSVSRREKTSNAPGRAPDHPH